jgi:hypothetical protein
MEDRLQEENTWGYVALWDLASVSGVDDAPMKRMAGKSEPRWFLGSLRQGDYVSLPPCDRLRSFGICFDEQGEVPPVFGWIDWKSEDKAPLKDLQKALHRFLASGASVRVLVRGSEDDSGHIRTSSFWFCLTDVYPCEIHGSQHIVVFKARPHAGHLSAIVCALLNDIGGILLFDSVLLGGNVFRLPPSSDSWDQWQKDFNVMRNGLDPVPVAESLCLDMVTNSCQVRTDDVLHCYGPSFAKRKVGSVREDCTMADLKNRLEGTLTAVASQVDLKPTAFRQEKNEFLYAGSSLKGPSPPVEEGEVHEFKLCGGDAVGTICSKLRYISHFANNVRCKRFHLWFGVHDQGIVCGATLAQLEHEILFVKFLEALSRFVIPVSSIAFTLTCAWVCLPRSYFPSETDGEGIFMVRISSMRFILAKLEEKGLLLVPCERFLVDSPKAVSKEHCVVAICGSVEKRIAYFKALQKHPRKDLISIAVNKLKLRNDFFCPHDGKDCSEKFHPQSVIRISGVIGGASAPPLFLDAVPQVPELQNLGSLLDASSVDIQDLELNRIFLSLQKPPEVTGSLQARINDVRWNLERGSAANVLVMGEIPDHLFADTCKSRGLVVDLAGDSVWDSVWDCHPWRNGSDENLFRFVSSSEDFAGGGAVVSEDLRDLCHPEVSKAFISVNVGKKIELLPVTDRVLFVAKLVKSLHKKWSSVKFVLLFWTLSSANIFLDCLQDYLRSETYKKRRNDFDSAVYVVKVFGSSLNSGECDIILPRSCVNLLVATLTTSSVQTNSYPQLCGSQRVDTRLKNALELFLDIPYPNLFTEHGTLSEEAQSVVSLNFLRGADPCWANFYYSVVGEGECGKGVDVCCRTILRGIKAFDLEDESLRVVQTSLEHEIGSSLQRCTKGLSMFRLWHLPGAGASTVSRRICWNLRTSHPCALLLMKNLTSPRLVEQAAETLKAYFRLVKKPLFVVLDGQIEDRDTVLLYCRNLQRQLRGEDISCVSLCVIRVGRASDAQIASSSGHDWFLDSQLRSHSEREAFDRKFKDVSMAITKLPQSHRRPFLFGLLAFVDDFSSQKGQTRLSVRLKPFLELLTLEERQVLMAASIFDVLFNKKTYLPHDVAKSIFGGHDLRRLSPAASSLIIETQDGLRPPIRYVSHWLIRNLNLNATNITVADNMITMIRMLLSEAPARSILFAAHSILIEPFRGVLENIAEIPDQKIGSRLSGPLRLIYSYGASALMKVYAELFKDFPGFENCWYNEEEKYRSCPWEMTAEKSSEFLRQQWDSVVLARLCASYGKFLRLDSKNYPPHEELGQRIEAHKMLLRARALYSSDDEQDIAHACVGLVGSYMGFAEFLVYRSPEIGGFQVTRNKGAALSVHKLGKQPYELHPQFFVIVDIMKLAAAICSEEKEHSNVIYLHEREIGVRVRLLEHMRRGFPIDDSAFYPFLCKGCFCKDASRNAFLVSCVAETPVLISLAKHRLNGLKDKKMFEETMQRIEARSDTYWQMLQDSQTPLWKTLWDRLCDRTETCPPWIRRMFAWAIKQELCNQSTGESQLFETWAKKWTKKAVSQLTQYFDTTDKMASDFEIAQTFKLFMGLILSSYLVFDNDTSSQEKLYELLYLWKAQFPKDTRWIFFEVLLFFPFPNVEWRPKWIRSNSELFSERSKYLFDLRDKSGALPKLRVVLIDVPNLKVTTLIWASSASCRQYKPRRLDGNICVDSLGSWIKISGCHARILFDPGILSVAPNNWHGQRITFCLGFSKYGPEGFDIAFGESMISSPIQARWNALPILKWTVDDVCRYVEVSRHDSSWIREQQIDGKVLLEHVVLILSKCPIGLKSLLERLCKEMQN